MAKLSVTLPFTPLHRHEVRNAFRLSVFRAEITSTEKQAASALLESDLKSEILSHTSIPWTDAFRKSEQLGERYGQALGVRATDLLHVAIACELGVRDFLTFDQRQGKLAEKAGLRWLK